MRRAILKLGDKTTAGGVVLEGIDSCMHHGTPMTFIGAKIWCPACNSEGVIGWKGPHQKATMMGKQQALEGDICLCNCDPAPVLLASQNSAWHVFESHELKMVTGVGHSSTSEYRSAFDEQIHAVSGGVSLEGYPYYIETPSGKTYSGRLGAEGLLPRIATDEVECYTVYWGDEALAIQA